ncbi:hypothetical protein EXS66_02000 [Candidatus Saccharibacteria bacterium]|nr:hypothetical protein [Candidatus Saccharibacteria bacterium]
MDESTAVTHLGKFLEGNLKYAPTESFELSKPKELTVEDTKIYYVWWLEKSTGNSARGGHQYYIFPDGRVLLALGGTRTLEDSHSVWTRWKNSNTG